MRCYRQNIKVFHAEKRTFHRGNKKEIDLQHTTKNSSVELQQRRGLSYHHHDPEIVCIQISLILSTPIIQIITVIAAAAAVAAAALVVANVHIH